MENNPYASPPPDKPNAVLGEVNASPMVWQVRVVAILNAVQGGLEIIMGLFLLAGAFMMWYIAAQGSGPNMRPGEVEILKFLPIIYSVFSLLFLTAGGLRVFACVRNWNYRGRGLGITSLAFGALTSIGLYCAPTGIALLIYGLIVYLNSSVADAFERGKRGESGEKIMADFTPPRNLQR